MSSPVHSVFQQQQFVDAVSQVHLTAENLLQSCLCVCVVLCCVLNLSQIPAHKVRPDHKVRHVSTQCDDKCSHFCSRPVSILSDIKMYFHMLMGPIRCHAHACLSCLGHITDVTHQAALAAVACNSHFNSYALQKRDRISKP